ncbi:hypothetical protein LDENG_00121850 [Lucifuga dentata]|nr:hypothetical protein LDENG_00121850 [Lucifuga dentata]
METPLRQTAFDSLKEALMETPILHPPDPTMPFIFTMDASNIGTEAVLPQSTPDVGTDHSALQWLMSLQEPEGQLACWIEELQAYEFTVQHRANIRTQKLSPTGHAVMINATNVRSKKL